MVLKLHDLSRFLRIVKLYDNKQGASKHYVKKTFNDEPVKEARLPNYFEIEKFCNESKIIEIKDEVLFLTELGNKVLAKTNDDHIIPDELEEILINDCILSGDFGDKIIETL